MRRMIPRLARPALLLILSLGASGIVLPPAGAATLSQSSPAVFQGIVDLPGVHLWYTDTGGDGVPVLLLHANAGNADSWENNLPAFVNAGYRAIAFDRRGWG